MTKGLGGVARLSPADVGAIPLGDAINHVVGDSATFLTNPGSAKLLVMIADSGDFRVRLGARLGGTVTATAASDEITLAGHGMETGEGPIQFVNSGGALPAGLAASTDYWVVKIDADTFKVATSEANAEAATATVVDITDAGTGTNSMVAFPAAIDPTSAELPEGQGSLKVAAGTAVVLPAPNDTVTVKGYASTDVLTYWWL